MKTGRHLDATARMNVMGTQTEVTLKMVILFICILLVLYWAGVFA